MKIIGVIPCRYQSSRFPGKPLALIGNKPMMWHVYQRALESGILDEVYIATDDERIVAVANEYNLNTVMTSDKHETGTDRVAEVADKVDADYYVNIQGDEPFIDPKTIKKVAQAMIDCNDPTVQSVNTCTLMQEAMNVGDENIVKVIMGSDKRLLALSRYPIPYSMKSTAKHYKHLGLYAFKRGGLQVFNENTPGDIERTESIEMYRLLENGYNIQMVETGDASISVDTPSDLKRIQEYLSNG
jgi:3-deoxy-manno-octulosonate cytidylyltransferase (CMP-KDO synthetase)